MAQQLQAQSEEVAVLTMIDAGLPNPDKVPFRFYRPPEEAWHQHGGKHPVLAGVFYPFLPIVYLFASLYRRLARIRHYVGMNLKGIWTKVHLGSMGNDAVDPFANKVDLIIHFTQELFGASLTQLGLTLADLLPCTVDQQLVLIWQRIRAANVISQDVELSQIRRLFRIFEANVRAAASYIPQPYSGTVLFIGANDDLPVMKMFLRDPTGGWGRVLSQNATYRMLPGNHHSIILEPHVDKVAETMKEQFWSYRF
jgi:thioesterase domain-containing protein